MMMWVRYRGEKCLREVVCNMDVLAANGETISVLVPTIVHKGRFGRGILQGLGGLRGTLQVWAIAHLHQVRRSIT